MSHSVHNYLCPFIADFDKCLYVVMFASNSATLNMFLIFFQICDNYGLMFASGYNDYTPEPLDAFDLTPAIIPFWSDTVSSSIYFRETFDADVLARFSRRVNLHSDFTQPTFTATSVFVVTWYKVNGFYVDDTLVSMPMMSVKLCSHLQS